MRRAAKLLKIHPVTVARKLKFLSKLCQKEQEAYLEKLYQSSKLSEIQFDDLETHEHSKCKPLSVTLAVEPKTRKILDFQVSRMPAKGSLAKVALKKYGPRKDDRKTGWNELFCHLKPFVEENAKITSDENPHYPRYLKKHYPIAQHLTVKGKRGCIVGQGELKKIGFDPLFSLNHTCAMMRANVNRLFRRTWCTTKKLEALKDHIHLYMHYHNTVLT